MIYEVYITETLCRTERVEATSEAEAMAAVERKYNREEIILDYSDIIEVQFTAALYDDEKQDN